MINPKLRKSLSQDVRRLITGRMTTDAFDDAFYELYASSEDRAVSEIATYCYCLYSSDLPHPYRLRGRNAVDSETRTTAARSVLFLRSGRDYEWPPSPDDPGQGMLAGLAMFLGIPTGIALSLICIPVALSGSNDGITGPLAILGLMLLFGSTLFTVYCPRMLSDDWKTFRQSGDHAVWPFIRCRDFEMARNSCHLLANGNAGKTTR